MSEAASGAGYPEGWYSPDAPFFDYPDEVVEPVVPALSPAGEYEARLQRLETIALREHQLHAERAEQLAWLATHPLPLPDARPGMRPDAFVADEIAMALRWSFWTTRNRIHTARRLVERLPKTLEALRRGEIAEQSAAALADATAKADDATTAKIEARVLERASNVTPAEFRQALGRAVKALDPREAKQREDDAVESRTVYSRPLEDGVGQLGAVLPNEGLATVMSAIAARVATYGADDLRTREQQDADALVDICADTLHPATTKDRTNGKSRGTEQGRPIQVNLHIALSTLLGLDEQPGEIEGFGLIGSDLARALTVGSCATWRTLISDDHGHLLDYGRSTYRPPAALRDFVIARDRTCRVPGCHRPARRCDLDHRKRWTRHGHTNKANMHPLCEHHHLMKEQGGWQVQRDDDVTTWTSPTGRKFQKPPDERPIDTTYQCIGDDPPPF